MQKIVSATDRSPVRHKVKLTTPYDKLRSLSPRSRFNKEWKSVTLIQKWVRGHQARAAAKKQKQVNFKEMRKLRRMLSVAYGRLRTKKIKQII